MSGCAGSTLVFGGVAAVLALVVVGFVAISLPRWTLHASLRGALQAITGGEVDFGRVRLHERGAVVTDLSVTRPGGQPTLRVERLDLIGEPGSLTGSEWRLDLVRLEGVRLQLIERDGGLALPPATWALLTGAGDGSGAAPRVVIGALEVHRATLDGQGRGALGASLDVAIARDILFDPEIGVRFTSAELTGLRSHVDGRRLVDMERLTLDADGVLTAHAPVGAIALRESGLPVWPPLVELAVPRWAGGRAANGASTGAPWAGLDPSTWPWTPRRAQLASGRVRLTDMFIASRPKTWSIAVSGATLGPMERDRLPFAARASVASGAARASGQLRRDGSMHARVTAEGLDAAAFDPYLELDRLGVSVREGGLDAALDIDLRGSALATSGDVRLTNVRFNRTSAFSGLNKALLTTASWLVGGHDKAFEATVSVNGDFTDPSFSPFRQVFGQVGRAVVQDAGARVGKGADTVKGSAGRLWRGATGLIAGEPR